ncbi:hypothetical protein ACVI1J_001401 [Bradyrhizobium diazoefficiens]
MLAVLATDASADVLRCKIDGFNQDILITTAPDTNLNDGKYARIGVSRGVGNRAIGILAIGCSSDTILKAELEREGWGPIYIDNINNRKPPDQYVSFKRHISLFFVEVAGVVWKSDDSGNLIEIRGSYFRDVFFKQG